MESHQSDITTVDECHTNYIEQWHVKQRAKPSIVKRLLTTNNIKVENIWTDFFLQKIWWNKCKKFLLNNLLVCVQLQFFTQIVEPSEQKLFVFSLLKQPKISNNLQTNQQIKVFTSSIKNPRNIYCEKQQLCNKMLYIMKTNATSKI